MAQVKPDIRKLKNDLRSKYKQIRRDMPAELKRSYDEKIFSRLVNLDAYKNSGTVLAYVSTDIEVDTLRFIEYAINDGKTVAVPKCINGTRNMEFYVINSLDDLEPGAFSVLEPVAYKCGKLTDFYGAMCLVPALVYDRDGFRLGYGKGYYDRFLSAHRKMRLVGITYCSCTVTELMHGRFDIAVDTIVTEKYVKNCGKAEID